MKLSARTVCPTYGEALPALMSSARKGKVFGVFDDAIWVRVENRLIMIASNMRLFSPFTLIVPEHVLANLQMELTLGDLCLVNAEKSRLAFEATGQTLQLLTHWRTGQTETHEAKKTLVGDQIDSLIHILLNFLSDSRKEWEWKSAWDLSFLTYSPVTLSEFISSLVLTFTSTSEDPSADFSSKWERLDELEAYLATLLEKSQMPTIDLSSFRDQWEFKGALFPTFMHNFLDPRENYGFVGSAESLWLAPSERFLLGYTLGMLLVDSREPLAKRGDFMALSTYLWGVGSGETSVIFKEIFYYLSQGKSWALLENLMHYDDKDSYVHLLTHLDEVTGSESPFGLECVLGLLCRLIYENFERNSGHLTNKKGRKEKIPI